ncbi:hypothetical protein GCM10022419_008120 [Nonomuraea rosea]|uniref:Uncharacterized protein n=1 Tax=Nonomuraea rosea TaxID=638574 RepID=A0ABP6VEB7_9ACTN
MADEQPAITAADVAHLTRDPLTLAIGLITACRAGLPGNQLGAVTVSSVRELLKDRGQREKAADLSRFVLHLADLAARALAEWELATGDRARVDAALQEWGRIAAEIGR